MPRPNEKPPFSQSLPNVLASDGEVGDVGPAGDAARPSEKPPFSCDSDLLFQYVNVIVNQLSRLDGLVTSVVPGTIAGPKHPSCSSYHMASVTSAAPSLGVSKVTNSILFDSGALTKHSVLSRSFYDKLVAKGVPIIDIPIPPPKLTPVVGIDFVVFKTVLISVSVVDCESHHHTGDVVAYVVDMRSFDLIVNNSHSKVIFNRYFYDSRNWLVVSNPFRDGRQEESLVLDPKVLVRQVGC